MTWNYRVVHTTEDEEEAFAIYEVFYDEQGEPEARTESPSYPAGANIEALREDVRHYLAALDQPVLEDHLFPRHPAP